MRIFVEPTRQLWSSVCSLPQTWRPNNRTTVETDNRRPIPGTLAKTSILFAHTKKNIYIQTVFPYYSTKNNPNCFPIQKVFMGKVFWGDHRLHFKSPTAQPPDRSPAVPALCKPANRLTVKTSEVVACATDNRLNNFAHKNLLYGKTVWINFCVGKQSECIIIFCMSK